MSEIFTVMMPDIGEGVVEGEVIEWLKKTGDSIAQDEPVVIVMTDKATVELPAPYPGILSQQYVQPGQMAIKDRPLYDLQIAQKTAQHSTSLLSHPSPSKPLPASPPRQPAQQPARQPVKSSQRSPATPPLRKMAKELGVNIDEIQGTGKMNSITVEDIKKALRDSGPIKTKTPIPANLDDEIIPLKGIQKLMAHKMTLANAEIPHFSYFEQADAHRLVKLRQNFKAEAEKSGIHPTYMPFLIKALSLTIKQYPLLNSSVDSANPSIILHKHHHIGFAMSTRLGLIVPVLKDVESQTVIQIIEHYESLKKRALDNKLLPDELQGSTITLSNFGALGGNGLWATPIINFPETAILAVSKLHKGPLVINDEIVIRDVLNFSWSFDHRIIDGQLAAAISSYFCSLIQNPARLL